MKFFAAVILCALSACTSDDSSNNTHELGGLMLAREITNQTHAVELYTRTGAFEQGHNEIFLRIRSLDSQEFVQNATVSWLPTMHMSTGLKMPLMPITPLFLIGTTCRERVGTCI